MVQEAEMFYRPWGRGNRLSWLCRYALAVGCLNLIWETLQLPLYTIWRKGTVGEIAFAVLHCTLGDVLIAGAALTCALFLIGKGWPARNYGWIVVVAIGLGIAYTAFSEWRNAVLLETWAYSDLMPTFPGLPIGLSPILQWLFVPGGAFVWSRWATKRWSQAAGGPASEQDRIGLNRTDP
jgi:hypothetical protein